MSELKATLAVGESIELATGEQGQPGIAVRRLEDGSWQVWVDMGQNIELKRGGGPVRAAALRARCSTDRGWVIEREVRDWKAWVEWCVIPRLMPIDWDPQDEYAFVDEEYANYERDYRQDPAPHRVGARMWADAWSLRSRAAQWKLDMQRVREPDPDDVAYVVGDVDEWAKLLGLDLDEGEDDSLPF